ncbi:hypothetical protein PVK06_024526 [Gossypium arboreum]|uniref:RNase H type-1 domain-containing protein n=1 Tax=Gossypium arboreum TaxID=29729 RepID=A0ABR0PE66_GOSAR|nr:hypothetical protein PVK06_024526 [Gossypium arboreum]
MRKVWGKDVEARGGGSWRLYMGATAAARLGFSVSLLKSLGCGLRRIVQNSGWKPPDANWIKLNTNGAVKMNLTKAYSSGLSLAWHKGFRKVALECDNMEIVRLSNEVFDQISNMGVVRNIKETCNWALGYSSPTGISRSKFCTGFIANCSTNMEPGLCLFDYPPTGIWNPLMNDTLRVTSERHCLV